MHKDAFIEVDGTIIETKPYGDGLEYWVRYEDGRERSYYIRDAGFTARAGHELTELQFHGRPVAVRNEQTRRKLQILSGQDLLGSGPPVIKRGLGFWAIYFMFALPVTFGFFAWHDSYGAEYWDHHLLMHIFVNTVCLSEMFVLIFGLPLRWIFWDDVKRFKHNRRVKAANKTITALFNAM